MSAINNKMSLHTKYFPLLCWLLVTATPAAEPIAIGPMTASPQLDGKASDWQGVPAVRIPLYKLLPDSRIEATEVELQAGYFGNEIFFLARWRDSEPDLVHKPYVWDEAAGHYRIGLQREDRFALQFEISGDFSSDWLSGNSFTADMWHWKAYRSNIIGLAHDKMTEVSTTKLMRSARLDGPDGMPIYVRRPSDSGGAIYTTRRYSRRAKPVMPKYFSNPEVSGSVADITAHGAWAEGWWTLGLRRVFNTGNPDDVTFRIGESRRGAVAVFDASDNADHAISDTLEFRLY
ncbi:MAG: hypothetical protein GY802_06445 [Gammaproteobacteria bacterium]|nr:hypothetical protein [Gammaproteobacteria bacterium]